MPSIKLPDVEAAQLLLREKQIMLTEVCFMLTELMPRVATENRIPDYNHLIQNFSSRERGLYNLLVHTITSLHQQHRIEEKGAYQTEKEDILISLLLLGPVSNPAGFMKRYEQEIYHRLKAYFGSDIFTRAEAQQAINRSKTRTCEALRKLVKRGLIARGHYKNRGYHYQVMPTRMQSQNGL